MSERYDHKSFFDNCAPMWHHQIDAASRIRLRSIFREKVPALQAPVLDIGSGTGVLLSEFEENGTENYMIIEADFSLLMLDENRRQNGKHPAVQYTQTDAHHLPFKKAGFNSIVCFAAYAHFADKLRVIREFSYTLKPGGFLVILHLMCHYRLNEMHRKLGGAVGFDELPDVEEVAMLLSANDFSILHAEEEKDIFLICARK